MPMMCPIHGLSYKSACKLGCTVTESNAWSSYNLSKKEFNQMLTEITDLERQREANMWKGKVSPDSQHVLEMDQFNTIIRIIDLINKDTFCFNPSYAWMDKKKETVSVKEVKIKKRIARKPRVLNNDGTPSVKSYV